MTFRFLRRYPILFLTILCLAALIFFSFRSSKSPSQNFLERTVYNLMSPLAKGVGEIQGGVLHFYESYRGLKNAREENLDLKKELGALREKIVQLEENNRFLERAADQYRLSGLNPEAGVMGRVVGYDPESTFRSVTLDIGGEKGVREDQTVLAQGGLVGRILKVGPSSSQVLLLTDLKSAVDVLDARTRARGTLMGLRHKLRLNRDHWLTQVEYVSAGEEIRAGDLLLTTGSDEIFPKGIPVGVVSSVEKDKSGLFWRAEVEPYVELTKLEEVVVLKDQTKDQGP